MESATPDGHTAPRTHGTQAKPAVATHSETNAEWEQGADRDSCASLGSPRAEGFRAVTRPREPRAR